MPKLPEGASGFSRDLCGGVSRLAVKPYHSPRFVMERRLRRRSHAEEFLRRALALDPAHPEARRYLETLERERGG